jgi:Carboxypeptidase regulatory-like domain/Calcineurin-like phosphoesterase/Bacterial Ig domain
MKFPAITQERQRPLSPISILIFFLAAFWAFQPRASAQVNAPDFTVVVLPDPQNETQYFPQVLNSQTQWIVNNRQALNIQMVLTEGDNINDGASTAQLQNLDAAFRLLDNAGIPYLLAIGNHDYNGYNPKASRNLSGFNQWFGPGRYSGKAFFGGNFPSGSNANSYAVLTINGQQYLFITLEYRATSASLDWAESILAANPDKEAIVVAHSFVLKNNKREDLCDDQDMPAANATGQVTWMRLRKYRNITMFLSGHFTGGSGARRADVGDNGNLVNQLFANYQDYANGGNGWLRIMTFHPVTNSISVQAYSPYLNQYITDSTNQFTLVYHNNFPNTGRGTISGKVRNQSSCAAVAGIKVNAGTASTTSAADGSYQLSVPPGSYSVTASGSGWNTSSKSETVNDSLDTQMNFYLSPGGCTASTVGVTVCSPANGASVASPVRFTAAAKSTLPITAMRIYIDNVSAYLTSAASLDVSLAVASGTHNVVVQAWDSSGAVFKASPITLTVLPSQCSASGVGVTVCSPTPGATVTSPVRVTAAAKSAAGPITAMRIYVDNVSVYTINAAAIDTSVAISSGTRSMVVQAWDSTGAVFKTPLTIQVQ